MIRRLRDALLPNWRTHRKREALERMPKKNARAPAEWQDARAVPPRTTAKVASDSMRASMNSKFLFPEGRSGRFRRPLPIRSGWSRGLHPTEPEV